MAKWYLNVVVDLFRILSPVTLVELVQIAVVVVPLWATTVLEYVQLDWIVKRYVGHFPLV